MCSQHKKSEAFYVPVKLSEGREFVIMKSKKNETTVRLRQMTAEAVVHLAHFVLKGELIQYKRRRIYGYF